MPVQPSVIFAIALGGAAGALARFGIGQAVNALRPGAGFPIGTFVANMIGCVLIGFCYVWLGQRGAGTPAFRAGIQVGLIGALTTFSTYSLESLNLLAEREYAPALLNIMGSVVFGLLAAYLGIVIGRTMFSGG